MDTQARILELLESASLSGAGMAEALGMTRQAVHQHLKKLVEEGLVVKEGRTRGAVFRLSSHPAKAPEELRCGTRCRLAQTEEDRVFLDVALQLNLERRLRKEAWEIARYAFTEMLNNAIDHSQSREGRVEASLGPYEFRFVIRDFGIGVFASIASKHRFSAEEEAVAELVKGKTTTMPERHTGEGIFFTSKAADSLVLRSHHLEVQFDAYKGDVFVSRRRSLRGTEVRFSLSRNSHRKLEDIFSQYAPGEFDYQFNRTRVLVKLFKDAYLSRSEAKRLLAGLDKFREVVLDFRGVQSVGQGFADEIFRVFRNSHPQTEIKTANLDPSIATVIRYVLDKSTG